MAKNNFLLVDLNEPKTKKLAETITSATSRRILNHLTEKDDTESAIAKDLGMAISTVHYHLQKLVEAGLVVVEEFHYSKKGREVNHYKLANKYIIIAPKKVSGLREKLKGILPVFIGALGVSAIIKIVQRDFMSGVAKSSRAAPEMMAMADEADAAFVAQDLSVEVVSQPDIAMWFLAGSVVTLVLFLVYDIIKEKLKK